MLPSDISTEEIEGLLKDESNHVQEINELSTVVQGQILLRIGERMGS
jgi:hypothetical protein